MRVRSLLFAVAVAIGLFVPIQTQSAVASSASVASCYRQVGDHWECVTPGAFCPAAAHGLYGYSESGAKYQCVQDGSYWRWKPAGSSSGSNPEPSPKPTPKATPTPKPSPKPTTTPGGKPAKAKCSRAYLPLPDPRCTPGTRNPAVTQATIRTTICSPGFDAKTAPTASYLSALKVRQIAEYGYPDRRPARYQEDHLIPLLLGGSPKSVKNLWPEPAWKVKGRSAADKNAVERRLWKAVCAGDVPLARAQKAIAKDWRTAVRQAGL
ncbi:hypothetical protein GCM10023074_01040 [Microbispora amethystogenes]|uniref:HNH endonuclease n=1 Tax=Microbispora amethystogenes TaxID=1427754 RepID=A0ABQ4FKX8_9ACTN|nr:hypothetical protein Mam01_56360 [Microbispora amethystogenes]